MFNPSREQVRQFFFESWRKQRAREVLVGLEPLALEVILLHPEYHALLDDPQRSEQRDYLPEAGATNPFLHLSLHLALGEQLSIDQPPGIRAEFARLAAKLGGRHEACHAVMDCLGETLWRAQRAHTEPDALAYLECLKQR